MISWFKGSNPCFPHAMHVLSPLHYFSSDILLVVFINLFIIVIWAKPVMFRAIIIYCGFRYSPLLLVVLKGISGRGIELGQQHSRMPLTFPLSFPSLMDSLFFCDSVMRSSYTFKDANLVRYLFLLYNGSWVSYWIFYTLSIYLVWGNFLTLYASAPYILQGHTTPFQHS